MKLLPYARLLRLPNVFTAFADIAMGLCVTVGVHQGALPAAFPWQAVLLLVASGYLYCAGMVWNDYFDLEEDKKLRPFRPVASGKITLRTTVWIGTILMLAGWGCAIATGPTGAILGGLLVVAILLYDARIKRTPFAPIGMAACRFLNVLLGVSLAGSELPPITRVHLALTIGLYIVGVTWFARTEEQRSDPKVLTKAALVMLVAVVFALAVPTRVPVGTSWVFFPYGLVVFGFWVGSKVYAAVQKPTPERVQAGVKRSIFGLVVLDALLASVFVGWPGILIILLLVPAIVLGKWVYST